MRMPRPVLLAGLFLAGSHQGFSFCALLAIKKISAGYVLRRQYYSSEEYSHMARKFFPPDVWETMMKVITNAVDRELGYWKTLGFEVKTTPLENIVARIAGESVFSKLSRRQIELAVKRALLTIKKRSRCTPEKPEEVSANDTIPFLDLSHVSIDDLVGEVARRMKSDLPIERSFQIVEQLSFVRDDKAASIRQEMASLQEQEARLFEKAASRSSVSNGVKPHRPVTQDVMVCHSVD